MVLSEFLKTLSILLFIISGNLSRVSKLVVLFFQARDPMILYSGRTACGESHPVSELRAAYLTHTHAHAHDNAWLIRRPTHQCLCTSVVNMGWRPNPALLIWAELQGSRSKACDTSKVNLIFGKQVLGTCWN